MIALLLAVCLFEFSLIVALLVGAICRTAELAECERVIRNLRDEITMARAGAPWPRVAGDHLSVLDSLYGQKEDGR